MSHERNVAININIWSPGMGTIPPCFVRLMLTSRDKIRGVVCNAHSRDSWDLRVLKVGSYHTKWILNLNTLIVFAQPLKREIYCYHSKEHNTASVIDRLKSHGDGVCFVLSFTLGFLNVAQHNLCQSEHSAEGHSRTLPRASQSLKGGVPSKS